ncbi:unnamed protein product [Rotaria sp. Silwood1]|nr:unnamed protein product [Rotaria sp. Silwood1]
MDPLLIRNIPNSRTVSKKKQQVQTLQDKQIQLPKPLPLGLLQNDRSILTTNEWTLLSNFLHTFDERNISKQIQCSVNELSSLPPKLRSKTSELTNLVRELYGSVGSLIERSPDFSSLLVHDRQVLTKNNLYITAMVNVFFLSRELNLIHNMTVFNASNQMCGSEFVMECCRIITRYDPNGSLIKIFIFILAFSSNCSIIKYDDQIDISIMSSSINLVRIQNEYVTVLWKYLVYLYGFKEAVLRFTCLVKNVLDLVNMLNQTPQTETRNHMVGTIVTETERILVIGH